MGLDELELALAEGRQVEQLVDRDVRSIEPRIIRVGLISSSTPSA